MADVWQSPGWDLGCAAPHPEPRVAHGRSAHSLCIFAGGRGEGAEPEPGCGPLGCDSYLAEATQDAPHVCWSQACALHLGVSMT